MRVVWAPTARRHLAAIRDHIADHDPRAARATADAIRKAVEGLRRFPHLGRPGRVPGSRELVVARTPYVIAYTIRDDRIEVSAVLHGRRRWPVHLP